MTITLRILAVWCLVTSLAGQCPPSEGSFAGVPVALSVRELPGTTFDPAQVYRKRVGFFATPPATPTFANGLHFDLATVLRACANGTPPDVDDFSLGLDWVLADNATGKVAVPPDRWGALTVSVTPATQGRAGGVIRAETGRPDGAAADVFSFYLPGSAVPATVVGRTQRALDSREVDVNAGPVRNDVDGLDLFVPMYGLEPALVSAMLPAMPRLFFTVSAATLARAPATWFSGTPSAATILEVRWSASARGWTCPRTFLRYDQLGLGVEEDVDGLAVDLANQRILLSTKTTRRNALLFVYYGAGFVAAAAVPYVDVDNVPISDKLGLIGDDDLDAICALDPSIRAGQGGPNPAFFAYGTPRNNGVVPPTPGLSASAFRDFANNQVSLQSFVVGWPATGPGAGLAVLFVTLPDSFNPIVLLASAQRNTAAQFCGDPRRAPLTIPANLSLHAQPLYLRWFVADAAFTTLGEAHPLQVRL
jgi:hypothetical protein